ncbi:hypothetical protein EXN66_Car012189 [Channa argus]|uniref:Uncharacterized protein n=1 Tax=Channa argus TaxID=215402 RepID=A0A6G1Q1N2_CHAAH|nr:hypothetical protein EXN66_Car012189 [Channa argus]
MHKHRQLLKEAQFCLRRPIKIHSRPPALMLHAWLTTLLGLLAGFCKLVNQNRVDLGGWAGLKRRANEQFHMGVKEVLHQDSL